MGDIGGAAGDRAAAEASAAGDVKGEATMRGLEFALLSYVLRRRGR